MLITVICHCEKHCLPFLVSTTLSFSMVPRAASSTVAARHRTARHWGRGTALAPQRRPPAQTRLVLPLGTLNRYPALYRTYSLCRTEYSSKSALCVTDGDLIRGDPVLVLPLGTAKKYPGSWGLRWLEWSQYTEYQVIHCIRRF